MASGSWEMACWSSWCCHLERGQWQPDPGLSTVWYASDPNLLCVCPCPRNKGKGKEPPLIITSQLPSWIKGSSGHEQVLRTTHGGRTMWAQAPRPHTCCTCSKDQAPLKEYSLRGLGGWLKRWSSCLARACPEFKLQYHPKIKILIQPGTGGSHLQS
jgi:hypothetical protein